MLSLTPARRLDVICSTFLAALALTIGSATPGSAEQTYDKAYFARDPDLGYGLLKDARAVRSVKRLSGGALVYDVVYTIDRGIRVTPAPAGSSGAPVLFFGCSFTYGEGVGDGDTLAAQLARIAHRPAYNLALHGYGTHQFLRQLETRRPEEAGVRAKPALVVYVLLPFHVDRAAGRSPWDKKGPLYSIAGGVLVHRGPFDSPIPLKSAAARSSGTMLSRAWSALTGTTEEYDRIRVAEMIHRAQAIVRDRYDSELLVVLWDWFPRIARVDQRRAAWFRSRLQGVPLLVVSELQPAPLDAGWYVPHDNHPTRRAFARVAEAIAAHMSH